jgi:hypothetical protein
MKSLFEELGSWKPSQNATTDGELPVDDGIQISQRLPHLLQRCTDQAQHRAGSRDECNMRH